MPNHIKNKLKFSGEINRINSLYLRFSTFHKDHEEGNYTQFPDFKKVITPPDHPAYRDEPSQEIAKKSKFWWYEWNIVNWGTKWNSYSCNKESDSVFTFETAWSSVPNIIELISTTYPDLTIEYTWADEDIGSNTGIAIYRNGLIELSTPKSQSKEAYNIAFALWPDRKEDFELVNGKYQYKDED